MITIILFLLIFVYLIRVKLHFLIYSVLYVLRMKNEQFCVLLQSDNIFAVRSLYSVPNSFFLCILVTAPSIKWFVISVLNC